MIGGKNDNNNFIDPLVTRPSFPSMTSNNNNNNHDDEDNVMDGTGASSLENRRLLFSSYHSDGSSRDKVCHFYNKTACSLGITGEKCSGTEICSRPTDTSSHDVLCYVLWSSNKTSITDGVIAGNVNERNQTEEQDVLFKGCWLGKASECAKETTCVEKRKAHRVKKDLLFCCCSGNHCNEKAIHDPQEEDIWHHPGHSSGQSDDRGSSHLPSIIFAVGFIITVVVFGLLFVFYKKYLPRKPHFDPVATSDESDPLTAGNMSFDPTRLEPPSIGPASSWKKVAEGRCGFVFRAPLTKTINEADDDSSSLGREDSPVGEKFVAVKVCNAAYYSTWEQECKVYLLPQMKHDNILAFKGSKKSLEEHPTSYWIVTEYHDNGSLHDFLKLKTVSFGQMLHIAQGIARGLSHLHEELFAYESEGHKPTVAHRDFKSKNVLLKTDMTPCIADFGLALIISNDRKQCDSLGQVGTVRYMAPEVLEGAVSYSRDALLRIDMYACGLVLWELASRCQFQQDINNSLDDHQVLPYRLPFEEEIPNATLHEMQSRVPAPMKLRPVLLSSWKDGKHEGMKSFCSTIEELWEDDAEARLSASCVEERIKSIRESLGLFSCRSIDSSTSSSAGYATGCTDGSLNSKSSSFGVLAEEEMVSQPVASSLSSAHQLNHMYHQQSAFELQSSNHRHHHQDRHNVPDADTSSNRPLLNPITSFTGTAPVVVIPQKSSSSVPITYSSRFGNRLKDSSTGSTTPLLMKETST